MKRLESKAKSGDGPFELLWDIKALNAVENIYKYISEKSLQGAENVREEIFAAVEALKENPDRFPADRDLKEPYRRCLVRDFRIIFRIYYERRQVLIIHIWNSKRSTKTLFKEINQ